MKAIIKAAVVALFAVSFTACGHNDDSEPTVIITTNNFNGVYEGKTTTVAAIRSEYGDFDDSGITDSRITLTQSQSGESILISDLVEDCIITAKDRGDWLAIDNTACVAENDGLRVTMSFEGEGEFTRSGKLAIEVIATVTLAQEVHYNHGVEWEVVAEGESDFEFEGRAL